MKFRMTVLGAALGMLMVLLVAGGCKAAVSKPEPAPEPSPTPVPTVHGVWSTTHRWYHDGRHLGMRVHTLTFTSTRYIERIDHVCDVSECPDDDGWTHSGTWSVSDTDSSVITRTFLEYDEDVLQHVEKEHYFVEGGDVLVMQWWHNDRDSTDFARYTRVPVPVPQPAPSGAWSRSRSYEDDDGNTVNWSETFTFSSDDVLSLLAEVSGPDPFKLVISGTFVHDPENLFILWEVESLQTEPPLDEDADNLTGRTLRLAYAPTSDPNRMVVSPWWDEQDYDPVSMQWVDNVRHPFGAYDVVLERVMMAP